VATVAAEFEHAGARVVADSARGVGRARNVGIRAAQCELVLMTDDDCTVAPDWVGAGRALLEADPGRIVSGRVLAGGESGHVPSTRESATREDYTGRTYCAALYSANMAAPRSALLAVGGFDETLETAEDNDLCYRWLQSGRSLWYEPSMVIWHHDWRNPAQLTELYVAYWRGQGAFYGKHLRRGDLRILRFLADDLHNGALALAEGVVRRRPRWTDWRRGMLRGLPIGLIRGWRASAAGRAA
jgi:GT2 family glycosyltransferase